MIEAPLSYTFMALCGFLVSFGLSTVHSRAPLVLLAIWTPFGLLLAYAAGNTVANMTYLESLTMSLGIAAFIVAKWRWAPSS